ncbi:uncharacterized protein LOC123295062 isoform X2 [Chrysoperla carnea]|nr:uncharacterized protein LOC123295062 isoform X2 [Chrysoperla carnea]
MFTTMLTIVKVIIVASICVTIAQARPKKHRYDNNKPKKEEYDQKQTGDYNIRLHLKDFQIIALLNDGLGDLGDYDYNYDYSELTIKPVLPVFTTPSSVPTSSTTLATSNPEKNSTLSNVTEQPTSTTNEPLDLSTTASTGPTENLNEQQNLNVTKLENNSSKPENSTQPDSDIIFLHNNTKPLDNETLIAVQVLYEALNGNNLIKSAVPIGFESNKIPLAEKSELSNKENTTAIVIEDVTELPSLSNQTTVSSSVDSNSLQKRRRCINGYRKDKLGRCRRLRRPGIP